MRKLVKLLRLNLSRLLVMTLSTSSLMLGATPVFANEHPVPVQDRMTIKGSLWDPRAQPGDDPKRWLYGMTFQGGQNPGSPAPLLADDGKGVFCESLSPECLSAEQIYARGYAPMCSPEFTQSACISKVELRVASSSWSVATPIREFNAAPSDKSFSWFDNHLTKNPQLGEVTQIARTRTWSESKSISAPASAQGPMLFDLPTIPNAGGSTLYLVDVSFEALIRPKAKSTSFNEFRAAVYPIVVKPMPESHRGVDIYHKLGSGPVGRGATGPVYGGADFQFDGEVAYSARFNPGVEVRVVLQIPKTLGGWFHSRLSEPEMQLEEISPNVNELTISGRPAEIPITNVFVQGTDPKYRDLVLETEPRYWFDQHVRDEEAGKFAGVSGGLWSSNNGTSTFEKWQKLMSDQAKGSAQTWLVSRMPIERLGSNRCLNDTSRIQGLINTNAMVYQSQIPVFVDGFLSYGVAGVHRDMNGQLNLGEYDLSIASETARCLYGFSKAPISAAIQVVNDQGSQVVATTEVNERGGYLNLSAKGFTFSQKQVRVNFEQPNPPKRLTFTLPPFAKQFTNLSSSQRKSVVSFVAESRHNSKVACTAYFVKASEKNLATARAKSACAYAKTLNPKLAYTSVAKQTKTASLNGRVVLSSN